MGEQLLGSPRPGHGRVFVLCDRYGEWSASWQDDYPDDEVGDAEPDAGVEDFGGTEEEVIRWARSRCQVECPPNDLLGNFTDLFWETLQA